MTAPGSEATAGTAGTAGSGGGPPPNMNQVGSIDELGDNEFKQKLGDMAPTTPLIIVFFRSGDDVDSVNQILANLSMKFPKVFFLRANVEKNEKAANEFGVTEDTETPKYIAFKNHSANGDYVGNDLDGVEGLVKSIVPPDQGGDEGWFGAGGWFG